MDAGEGSIMEHETGTVSQPAPLHRLLGLAIAGAVALTGCTGFLQQSDSPTAIDPTPTSTLTPSPTVTPTVIPTSPLPSPSPSPTITPTTAATPTLPPGSDGAKPETMLTIEKQVGELVAKNADLTVQSVTCPATIDQKSSQTYECQVRSEAGDFVVVIQPTGQTGKFRWGTKGLLLLSKLDPLIQRSVAGRGGGKVTVDCGSKAKTAKQGETFDCRVTDAKGKTSTARITVRDQLGNVYVTVL